MSNRNIPDPNKNNQQLLARLWDAAKQSVMENVIFHVLNAGDLRGE